MRLSFQPVLLLLYISLSLTSCNGNTEEKIGKVTKEFAEAFYNFDFEEAQKHVTSQSNIFIVFFASNVSKEAIGKLKKAGRAKADITRVTLNEDGVTATVKCRITNHLKLNFIEETSTMEETSDKEFDLIKSGEVWLVDLHP